MRHPGGYLFSFDVGGVQQEHDTFSCKHCNRVVIVKPKCDPADMGGLCRICDGLICSTCVDTGRCDPLEEKLKRAEDRYNTLKSYGM